MIPRDAPLRPDAPTARDLARRELSRAIYAEHRPGLLQRALDAVDAWLDRLSVPQSSPGRVVALVLIGVLVLLVVVLTVRAVGGRRRRARAAAAAVLSVRTVAALRQAADAAAAAGDWDTALRERFRALVRAAQERDEVPVWRGLTAAEAAERAGVARGDLAASWRAAADRFEAVAYGGEVASAADDEALRRLDDAAGRPAPVVVA